MLRTLVRPIVGTPSATATIRSARRLAAPIAAACYYLLLTSGSAVDAACNVSVRSLVHEYAVTTSEPTGFYDAPNSTSFTRLIVCAKSPMDLADIALGESPEATAAIALLRSMPPSLARARALTAILNGTRRELIEDEALHGLAEEQELPGATASRLIRIANSDDGRTPPVLQQDAIDTLPVLAQPNEDATRVLDAILNRNVEPRFYTLQAHAAQALLRIGAPDNGAILKLADELPAIERREPDLALLLAEILYAGGEHKRSGPYLLAYIRDSQSGDSDRLKVDLFNHLLSRLNTNEALESPLVITLQQSNNIKLIPQLDIDELIALNAPDAARLSIAYLEGSQWADPGTFSKHAYYPDSIALQQLTRAVNEMRVTGADSSTRRTIASDINQGVLPIFAGYDDPQTSGRRQQLSAATALLSEQEHAPLDWAALAATVGLVIGLLYLLLSFGALLAARWHERTLEFLSDPLLSKVVGWPHLFLRFSKPLQIWVLEPWFAAVQRREANEPDLTFFPIQACAGDGEHLAATDLIQQLRAGGRLWLQGNSGMGKSKLANVWQAQFLKEAKSLRHGVKLRGFVLVTVPLRRYANIDMRPGLEEEWVIEATHARLRESGMVMHRWLVESMLRTGTFALILDGMNEVDRSRSLEAFALAFPTVPLLVTSQTDGCEPFENWALPVDTSHYFEGLLELWMGGQRGGELAERLRESGLAAELRSGYDLRVVVDIASRNHYVPQFPATRTALYSALLEFASASDVDRRSIRALGWHMFLTGQRQKTEEQLKEAIGPRAFAALTAERAWVMRPVGGMYEFRHDLLLAYLAASWLIEDAPDALRALAGVCVFQCDKASQTELWEFVAELLPSEEAIARLWTFSIFDPERALLQAALLRRAQSLGIVLTVAPAERVA